MLRPKCLVAREKGVMKVVGVSLQLIECTVAMQGKYWRRLNDPRRHLTRGVYGAELVLN